MGVPRIRPCSLLKAIMLPVKVSEPSITSNPSAPILKRPSSAPWMEYSAMPTSAAASAPKACESAVRCGMAVIGIQMDIAEPMSEPTTRPAKIHS